MQWGKEQEGAFEGLKTALSEAPVLRPPQWGPKHGNADGLSRAKVKEGMMSCGIDNDIECAFRAEVENAPTTGASSIICERGKYTCRGPMNEGG